MTKTDFKSERLTAKALWLERRSRRRTPYPAQKVLLTMERGAVPHAGFRGGQDVARLIDISDGGLGIETLFPLPAGLSVLVSYELHNQTFCLGFQCRGRVVRCETWRGLKFRVGLSYEDITYRRLPCTHERGDPVGTLPLLPLLAGSQPSTYAPAAV